jgi:superfamily II DNA/RNA helicase
MSSFADLGVSPPVTRALAARGITAPFAVQRLVVADVLAGTDVLVQSPTGSGKTLAFAIPLVDRLRPSGRGPSALVLAPTRELACQIVDELESIAAARSLTVEPVYGGVGIGPQAKRAGRADIVVATPGRLEDLIARRAVTLAHVQMLVIDEADRMLDMGFKPAVDRIVALTPRDRQTLFFSATLEALAGRQARAYTRDPRRHVHKPAAGSKTEIEHRFVHVAHAAKLDALVDELRDTERGRTLVFVRTRRGADRLVKRLDRCSVRAVAMHGDKSQGQRERALGRFERGEIDTLVATDVAARGIDIAEITHVINFDVPGDSDAYVHRMGRTGRAGRTGAGVSLVLPDQVAEMRAIAKQLGLAHAFDRTGPHSAGQTHGRSHRPPGKRRRHRGTRRPHTGAQGSR